MEETILNNDIKVLYVTADSFPEGVMDAHKKIREIVPPAPGRRFFGISRPEKDSIVYKAAAEQVTQAEAEQLKLDSLVLKKGRYISSVITDFMNHIPAIGSTFQQLLSSPQIDPEGYCVEWYLNVNDVKCMVRLKDSE